MRGILVYDRKAAEYNCEYINLYRKRCSKMEIDLQLVLLDELDMGCNGGSNHILWRGNPMDKLDFAIVRSITPYLSMQLEEAGIAVFNSAKVSRICNHKAWTLQYVTKKNKEIPCVPTTFHYGNQAEKVLSRLSNDYVIKAVAGHGGSQVFSLLESTEDEILRGLNGCDFVVQPFIKGPGKDVRVYVIGKEIMGVVCRQAKEGFRANFSLGGQVEPIELTKEQKKLVEQVISLFDFGMVGIDFIVDEEEKFVLNEIEDVVGARMFYQCYNIDLVQMYLDYIVKYVQANCR